MSEKLYYTKPELQAELKRCLNCKKRPCMLACPVNCFSQNFVDFAKKESFDLAAQDIIKNNPFSQICGLVCPDRFCMLSCIRGKIDNPIYIPKVQASIMHYAENAPQMPVCAPKNGRHIAIVGGGPAGLSASYFLSQKGYEITIFEANDIIGGAMNLIPQVRLPRDVVQKEFDMILNNQNVHIKLNTMVENPADLVSDFDCVIVAKGMPQVAMLSVPGAENAISYIDYLKYPEKYAAYKNIAIVGGGLVAFDCAVIANQLQAESVYMFVRRDKTDMRISKKEHQELIDMQTTVIDHTQISAINKNESQLALTIKNSDTGLESLFDKPVDLLVMAIGNIAQSQPLIENVHYIGECNDGSLTVIEAIAAGKKMAEIL